VRLLILLQAQPTPVRDGLSLDYLRSISFYEALLVTVIGSLLFGLLMVTINRLWSKTIGPKLGTWLQARLPEPLKGLIPQEAPRITVRQTLMERIDTLQTALNKASAVVGEIEQEVEERQALVRRLEQDLETYDELIKLSKSEVEAVAQTLRGELQKQDQHSSWKSLRMNLVFFALGVLSNFLVGWWFAPK